MAHITKNKFSQGKCSSQAATTTTTTTKSEQREIGSSDAVIKLCVAVDIWMCRVLFFSSFNVTHTVL